MSCRIFSSALPCSSFNAKNRIIAVAADDLTGVGVADDFLFVPLGAGVGEGLIMIFG